MEYITGRTRKQVVTFVSFILSVVLVITYLLSYFGVYGDYMNTVAINLLPFIKLSGRIVLAILCYAIAIFLPLRIYASMEKNKARRKEIQTMLENKAYKERLKQDEAKAKKKKELIDLLRDTDA